MFCEVWGFVEIGYVFKGKIINVQLLELFVKRLEDFDIWIVEMLVKYY